MANSSFCNFFTAPDGAKEDFMQTTNQRRMGTRRLVLAAVMTALVIIFQLLATFTAFFGPFSTAMALIPIAIGATMCGVSVGGWLGLVFGIVVLMSGGANLFLAFDIPGTFVTVLAKGLACGLAAGLVYKLLEKANRYVAAVAAAIVCPVVNTGVFLLGCAVFFLDDAARIAEAVGLTDKAGMGVFFALAMANFALELVTNIVLSPVVVRILNIRKRAAKQ